MKKELSEEITQKLHEAIDLADKDILEIDVFYKGGYGGKIRLEKDNIHIHERYSGFSGHSGGKTY